MTYRINPRLRSIKMIIGNPPCISQSKKVLFCLLCTGQSLQPQGLKAPDLPEIRRGGVGPLDQISQYPRARIFLSETLRVIIYEGNSIRIAKSLKYASRGDRRQMNFIQISARMFDRGASYFLTRGIQTLVPAYKILFGKNQKKKRILPASQVQKNSFPYYDKLLANAHTEILLGLVCKFIQCAGFLYATPSIVLLEKKCIIVGKKTQVSHHVIVLI